METYHSNQEQGGQLVRIGTMAKDRLDTRTQSCLKGAKSKMPLAYLVQTDVISLEMHTMHESTAIKL